MRTRKRFKLWHSLLGVGALLVAELGALMLLHGTMLDLSLLLAGGVVGSVGILYVAAEIIEEVRGAAHMLVLLGAVTAEFIVFYALQYHYLLWLIPGSFPSLTQDPVSLLLHSTMVFVFNPLYVPATGAGRALLLLETLSALGLVLFILQNVTQFRREER